MFSKKLSSSSKSFLLIIVFLAFFLRFYNLLWGNGFFFHPDERNIASSLSQLKWPDLHPHFFAYGQFPIYLAYTSHIVTRLVSLIAVSLAFLKLPNLQTFKLLTSISFRNAVFWLRFWSALTGTLTIPLVYLVTKEILTPNLSHGVVENNTEVYALMAALLVAFTPGLIQAAHFGTTESLLTFFFLLLIYFSLLFLKTQGFKYLFYLGMTTGVALGTKLSSIFFIAAPILTIIFVCKKGENSVLRKMNKFFLVTICYLLFTLLFFFLSSPYNFLEFNEFLATTRYETGVAYGSIKVFYTRQFINTTPVVFQLKKIFPFALGWPIFLLGALGFLLVLAELTQTLLVKKATLITNYQLLITAAFGAYFFPNAVLFAKWTRFMTPIFPFFAIFVSFVVLQVYRFLTRLKKGVKELKLKGQNYSPNLKTFKFLAVIFGFSLLVLSLSPGLAFFSIYTRPDIRVQASKWIYQNIPSGSYILSETANVVDIPVGGIDKGYPCQGCDLKVVSFDFYHLDKNPRLFNELIDHLEKSDYLFIPSRRIFLNHMRLKDKYPLVNNYYHLLFKGLLGFEKIAEFASFPCPVPQTIVQKAQYLPTFYPKPASILIDPIYKNRSKICYLFSDERAEETFTVFDHPVIRIYKKVRGLTKEDYRKLLTSGLDLETKQIIK